MFAKESTQRAPPSPISPSASAHPAIWPTATALTPCGRSYIRLLRDGDGSHKFTRGTLIVRGHINYLQEIGKIDEETYTASKKEKIRKVTQIDN